MSIVFERTEGLLDMPFHYCPGCTHGIIHRLVAETLVELDLLEDAVCIASVGCSVYTYKYFDCVITSYSIHYTKLYDWPLPRRPTAWL